MFFDDLSHVFGLDLGVERAVGVDHDCAADGAEADGTARREQDFAHGVAALCLFALTQILFDEDAIEFGHNLFAPYGRTRFAGTYKNLTFYRSQDHRRELFELFAVGDEFRFRHNPYFVMNAAKIPLVNISFVVESHRYEHR